MGMSTYLYGCIVTPAAKGTIIGKKYYRHNKRVVHALPIYPSLEHFSKWPLFTKNMFAISPFSSIYSDLPHYDDNLIYFAGSYKNMYELDNRWVNRFEELLSILYWSEAIVHLHAVGTEYRYEWSLDIHQAFIYDPLTKRPDMCEWKRNSYINNLIPSSWEESVMR